MGAGLDQVRGGPLGDLGIALDVLDEELHRGPVDAAGTVDQIDVVLARRRDRDVGEAARLREIGCETDDEGITARCGGAVVEVGIECRVHIEPRHSPAAVSHTVITIGHTVIAVGHTVIAVSHTVITIGHTVAAGRGAAVIVGVIGGRVAAGGHTVILGATVCCGSGRRRGDRLAGVVVTVVTAGGCQQRQHGEHAGSQSDSPIDSHDHSSEGSCDGPAIVLRMSCDGPANVLAGSTTSESVRVGQAASRQAGRLPLRRRHRSGPTEPECGPRWSRRSPPRSARSGGPPTPTR